MSNGTLYYEIILGLRHKPEYLLLFAVVLVLAGGSTASLAYGIVAGSVATQIISLLALIMTLASTVLVIIVVRKPHTQSADPESVWSKFEATGVNNEEIVKSLAN